MLFYLKCLSSTSTFYPWQWKGEHHTHFWQSVTETVITVCDNLQQRLFLKNDYYSYVLGILNIGFSRETKDNLKNFKI